MLTRCDVRVQEESSEEDEETEEEEDDRKKSAAKNRPKSLLHEVCRRACTSSSMGGMTDE